MQEVRHTQDYAQRARRNYDVTAAPQKNQDISALPPDNKPRKNRRKFVVIILCLVLVLIAACIGGLLYTNSHRSPVPKNIRHSVSFPVYYPDAKKLPKGYTLNLNSFKYTQNGVVYTVSYGDNKKMVFSVQQQPADNVIQGFYSNYIPLRIKMQTTLGEAQIGAYGSGKNLKTIVSLPTNHGTWLIITAPYDINQTQLKQLLNSLKK